MNTRNPSLTWPARILLSSTIAGCVALAAFAQPVETPVPKTERIGRIAELVRQGQLNMVDAVRMAERHTKGVAFKARCVVKPGPFASNDDSSPEPGSDADAERLLYEIVCVLNEQPTTVSIDGKDRKVLTPKPPTPQPKPDPDPKRDLPTG